MCANPVPRNPLLLGHSYSKTRTKKVLSIFLPKVAVGFEHEFPSKIPRPPVSEHIEEFPPKYSRETSSKKRRVFGRLPSQIGVPDIRFPYVSLGLGISHSDGGPILPNW